LFVKDEEPDDPSIFAKFLLELPIGKSREYLGLKESKENAKDSYPEQART
jgi:hypothetical protein